MTGDERSAEDLARAIDDDPDPMHLDVTPAAQELGAMGLPAVPAILGVLEAEHPDTRLRAQRALEAVIYGRHGFVAGQGFPSDDAEDAARRELQAIGYDHEADAGARAAALERAREWLARAG
jgi:hypothetical protein